MSYVLRPISANAVVASGNVTVSEPTGAGEGDLLCAAIDWRGSEAFSLPSGWTLIDEQVFGNTFVNNSGGSSRSSILAARIIRGAAAPDLTFTRTGGDVAAGACWGYAAGSFDPADPIGSINLSTNGLSATLQNGGVTTTADNSLIVSCGAAARQSGTAMTNFRATDPATGSSGGDSSDPVAGAWKRFGHINTTTGADLQFGLAHAIRATAGATGNCLATAGLPSLAPLLTFVVNPAPAGGEVTGSGALQAGAADAAGTGTSESAGAGAVAAGSAATDGAGTSASTGGGDVAAQAAAIDGIGASASAGTGAMAAAASAVSGAGESASVGAGAAEAGAAQISGAGLSASAGAGAAPAGAAQVSGSGVQAVTGTGALRAAGAAADGAGMSASIGSGALGQGAAVAPGSGWSGAIGAGIVSAIHAVVAGAGISGSRGAGVLAAAASVVRGFVAPVIQAGRVAVASLAVGKALLGSKVAGAAPAAKTSGIASARAGGRVQVGSKLVGKVEVE
jgi:hypothetical protein